MIYSYLLSDALLISWIAQNIFLKNESVPIFFIGLEKTVSRIIKISSVAKYSRTGLICFIHISVGDSLEES